MIKILIADDLIEFRNSRPQGMVIVQRLCRLNSSLPDIGVRFPRFRFTSDGISDRCQVFGKSCPLGLDQSRAAEPGFLLFITLQP